MHCFLEVGTWTVFHAIALIARSKNCKSIITKTLKSIGIAKSAEGKNAHFSAIPKTLVSQFCTILSLAKAAKQSCSNVYRAVTIH